MISHFDMSGHGVPHPEMDTNSIDFLNFQLWLLKDISAA